MADGLLNSRIRRRRGERLGFGRSACQEKCNVPCVMGDQLTASLR